MMVSKIAKMVENGTNRQALVSKQRRQQDDRMGGTIGSLTDKEIRFVRLEVDRLIHTGDASEASLNRIAMQVRVAAKGSLDAHKSRPLHETNGRESHSSSQVETLPSLNTSKAGRHLLTPTALASKKEFYAEDGLDPWSLLCEKDKEDFSNEVINQRRSNRKKEIEQREYLDRQVRERSDAKKRLIHEERERAKEDQRQVLIWEEQAQAAKEAAKRKAEAEKRMFDEQLALSKAKKSLAEKQRREEEQRIAAEIQQGIQEEKRLALDRKNAAREEVARFAQTNFENKDNYRIQKAKAADEDARLQQAFLERLAKEEKAREENLLKLHERMSRQMEMAHTIQKTMAEKSAEDERKAAQYASQKEAKELASERAASERVALEKMKLRQALALQVLERDERAAKLKADDHAYKAVFRQEVEEAQRAEVERRVADRQRISRQRDILDAQMRLRSTQKHVVMSEAERQLNAKRLEEISHSRAR